MMVLLRLDIGLAELSLRLLGQLDLLSMFLIVGKFLRLNPMPMPSILKRPLNSPFTSQGDIKFKLRVVLASTPVVNMVYSSLVPIQRLLLLMPNSNR